MREYKQFHGEIQPSDIGKELRKILIAEKVAFKIITGYGSTSNQSKSKMAALNSLKKLKSEGLIKDYFSGDVLGKMHPVNSPLYQLKLKYIELLKKDSGFNNDGVIFVFVK